MSSTCILGDWGSSRLRVWLVTDGKAVEHREGPGMLGTTNPARALATVLAGWPEAPILLCGMAGARKGLRETAYAHCPLSAANWASAAATTEFGTRPLRVAAGVAYRDPDGRPDVMRGEEAQVFGAMALDPALAQGEHSVVLPGTHSKWVGLKDGEIVAFRTFMTGELFQVLKATSLFAVGGTTSGGTEEGFLDGLSRGASGSCLTSSLFEARSAQLVDAKSAGWADGFVSGLLIGAEIADRAREAPVTVIGEARLAARYATALTRAGVAVKPVDDEPCVIAGLRLLDDVA